MGNSGLVASTRRSYPLSLAEILEVAPFSPTDLLGVKTFPRNGWSPDLFGLSILADFARFDWRGEIKIDPPFANDDPRTAQEIEELVSLARSERPKRVEEIVDQDRNFHDYFAHFLTMTPASHPESFKLFKAGARVAEMLMVSYKLDYGRPRPQQLYPLLVPLFDEPGHSAYPSGHALISRLIALCLSDVVPKAEGPLIALAERIGRNREIAGVHYASDTAAGFRIAEQAHPILKRGASYQDVLSLAYKEWV